MVEMGGWRRYIVIRITVKRRAAAVHFNCVAQLATLVVFCCFFFRSRDIYNGQYGRGRRTDSDDDDDAR